jgi:pimeloyl-ACP methyl ester carboxylesterase
VRWFLLALLAGVALGSCGGSDDDGAAGEPPEPPPSLALSELEPCGDQPVRDGYRCGEIQVPLERAEPSLGSISVAFAVRPRSDRDRSSRGAIVAVEGGPGYASTRTAASFERLFGDLLDRRELVLVDMRGTGLSEPIRCKDVQQRTAPDPIALSACARKLGPRFESYRTQAAADDIDDVRRALGFDEITLYGDSYGTYLGQSYAFRHGDALNALVLDSAYPAFGEDPWYPSLTRTGVRLMSKACRRVATCQGDAGARLEHLVDWLRERKYSVGPLLEAIAAAAYGGPDPYVNIDEAGTELRRGDPAHWRRLTLSIPHGARHPRKYLRTSEFVVGCNDYPMIWDREASEPERREQLEQAIRDYDDDAFLPFRPREVALSADTGYLECLTWPPPTDLYEPPVPEGAEAPDVPVLVVSGEFDDLTTPWEGRRVASLFPDSKHFVARNAGHVDALYYPNGSAARKIRTFLRRELGG